jgi:hypothetical protein
MNGQKKMLGGLGILISGILASGSAGAASLTLDRGDGHPDNNDNWINAQHLTLTGSATDLANNRGCDSDGLNCTYLVDSANFHLVDTDFGLVEGDPISFQLGISELVDIGPRGNKPNVELRLQQEDGSGWGNLISWTVGPSLLVETSFHNYNPNYDPASNNNTRERYRLQMRGVVDPEGTGAYSASVELSPAPIPAALPLFGSALGLLGFTARRRRKQPA